MVVKKLCKYKLNEEGKIQDTVSGFVLHDNYWTCDLLNTLQGRVERLEHYIEEHDDLWAV